MVRKLILIGLVQALLVLGGCGGGGSNLSAGSSSSSSSSSGSSGSAANVVVMTVDGGPDTTDPDVDTPFITVTVCPPGSASASASGCVQIPDVEVDTGSYGLRIISSVLGSSLIASLSQEYAPSGSPLVECTQFVDGFSWGPVALANVYIGGESASNVPIQVMGDSSFENEIPSSCYSSYGSTPSAGEEDTVATFGANGIIGLGPFSSDCGDGCATILDNDWYYACPVGGTSASDCDNAEATVDQQVTNPVVDFTSTGDDNGVIIELPSVPDPDGTTTVTGSLVFGIGTEGNNSLGSATVLTADGYGDITTTFSGTNGTNNLPYSYLDTGSNAYYFDAANTTTIPDCPSSGNSGSSGGFSSSWLCPTSEQTLSLKNEGQNGTISDVSIKISDANTLFDEDNGNYTAFDDLGADTGSQSTFCEANYNVGGDCYFDLGLPFFFGRNVYVAIYGMNTSAGEGPYFAY